MSFFPILIQADESSADVMVTVPTLPNCQGRGETVREAVARAGTAIKACLAVLNPDAMSLRGLEAAGREYVAHPDYSGFALELKGSVIWPDGRRTNRFALVRDALLRSTAAGIDLAEFRIADKHYRSPSWSGPD